MKKLLLLLCLCFTSSAFATTLFEQTVEAAAQKALLQAQDGRPASSAGSYLRGVIPMDVTVVSSFVGTQKENVVTKPCTAVRIAPDYLLAGAACAGSRESGYREHYGQTKLDKHEIASVSLFGHTVYQKYSGSKSYVVPSWGNRVILIKLGNDKEGKAIKQKVAPLPIPNLFIPNNPKSLLFSEDKTSFFSQVTAKKQRIFGEADADREIEAVDLKNKRFDISPDILSGQPVFGVSATKNEEFLLGFGSELVVYTSAKKGDANYFTRELMLFLQAELDEASYKIVKNKQVDESYFK
jgi:hypothetical protein